ncbi:MAG TPA: SdrD B-like domain-containing protein [Dehalococcoidales bacterium]|nr:SdrD B-like domain-containing protein [Dehalococcoidales bacterium]
MRKHYLLTGVLLSALLLGSIAGANAPVAANNGVKVQLAMILDGSASIGYANWDIIKEGLASAVENTTCVPQDGSVELTVVQFGYPELAGYAKVEVSPTVIDSQATANAVAAIVRAMPYGNGNTPMAHGIKLAADTVATSTNFDPSLKQALNLFTDGSPNVCCPPWSCPTYKGNVVYVRNYALTTLQMTEDQDEFDAEGIGITTSNHDWLRDSIVWPQPGYDTWPPPGPGWVRVVADAAEFAETICEKFQLIVPPECVLTVESDGCCPIEVAYNGFAANVSAGGGENFTIPCCNNVTLTADDSDDCCDFVNWTGDVPGGTNSTNPITIHIDSSKNVTAHCSTPGPYTLKVTSDGCCPITVGTLGSVAAGGNQAFTDIPCCTYVTVTADDNDPSCEFDSWSDGGAKSHSIHMDSDKSVTAYCSAISAPGSLGDTVFYDNNGNGNQDPGEVGIAGVQVNLYKDDGNGLFNPTGGTDDFIGTRTTGGYGIYSFIDLPPFCDMGYWVLILENTLPPSLTLTTGSNPIGPICLEEGGYYDLADFGYQPPVPVGGEVYPVNKLAILMPWITLAALLAGSISWFAPRRREARS